MCLQHQTFSLDMGQCIRLILSKPQQCSNGCKPVAWATITGKIFFFFESLNQLITFKRFEILHKSRCISLENQRLWMGLFCLKPAPSLNMRIFRCQPWRALNGRSCSFPPDTSVLCKVGTALALSGDTHKLIQTQCWCAASESVRAYIILTIVTVHILSITYLIMIMPSIYCIHTDLGDNYKFGSRPPR